MIPEEIGPGGDNSSTLSPTVLLSTTSGLPQQGRVSYVVWLHKDLFGSYECIIIIHTSDDHDTIHCIWIKQCWGD